SNKLRQDALVERVVPDPAQHRPMTLLTGFVGKSARDGYWRLYLTAEFDEYVEFRDEDVENTEQLPEEQSSLGGLRVWIRKGATLEHTHITSHQVQAEFLRGGIASRFLPGSATAAFVGGRVVRNCPSFRIPCDDASEEFCRTGVLRTINLHIPACRSDAGLCGHHTVGGCGGGDSFGAFCPTREFVCGATIGCTFGAECGF
ncbi:MAG: hypothetical protein ACRELX_16020, partial [Longimicrobiales bacterium]